MRWLPSGPPGGRRSAWVSTVRTSSRSLVVSLAELVTQHRRMQDWLSTGIAPPRAPSWASTEDPMAKPPLTSFPVIMRPRIATPRTVPEDKAHAPSLGRPGLVLGTKLWQTAPDAAQCTTVSSFTRVFPDTEQTVQGPASSLPSRPTYQSGIKPKEQPYAPDPTRARRKATANNLMLMDSPVAPLRKRTHLIKRSPRTSPYRTQQINAIGWRNATLNNPWLPLRMPGSLLRTF